MNDWLGTRRVTTDYAGVVEQTCASLPYGDGTNCSQAVNVPNEQHFTGKIHDSESGLDYFGARYYSENDARFMSPDPLLSSGLPDNPQTWNRYAYGGNNPLRNVDPSGLYFFTNTCASSDAACNAAFTQMETNVRNMYSATQAAYNNAVKAGDTKAATALKRTLDGLGAEGQLNARGQTVNISVNLGLSAPGQTSFAQGSTSTINVVLNPNMSNGPQDAESEAAHEGVHADEIMPGIPTEAQATRLEHDAFETESYFAQSIGFQDIRSPQMSSDVVNGVLDMSKDFVLWNPSWATVDAATVSSMRSAGIDAAAKDGAAADCAQIGGCKK